MQIEGRPPKSATSDSNLSPPQQSAKNDPFPLSPSGGSATRGSAARWSYVGLPSRGVFATKQFLVQTFRSVPELPIGQLW